MMADANVCHACGQLIGIPEYDERLWDLHHRRKDGRQNNEPLVFDGSWLQEHVHDEEDAESVNLAMERDMRARGICGTCARPDLSGLKNSDFYSEEEAKEMYEMWAEQAAERRAGC